MENFWRNHIVFFVVAAAIATLVVILNLPFVPAAGWGGHDSGWYIKMAEGRADEVIQPFSGRFLYPFLAHIMDTYVFHDITKAFLFLAICSLLVFYVAVTVLLKKTFPSPFLLIPFLFLPYFLEMTREFFLPDIFYISLTALFFLFLFLRKEGLSLIVLFFLFLTRELAILPALILIGTSWFRSKRLLAVTALIVTLVSIYTSGAVGAMGEPNIHNLSTPVYMVLKLSYNFLANGLGIRLWVNTYDFCEPVFRVALPPLKSLGSLKEAGLCGFDPSFPIGTIVILLTVFGILPLLLFRALRGKYPQILKDAPFWLLIALVYGLLQYIVGIPAGTGVGRIVGYGWPAFLLAAPFLVSRFFKMDKKLIVKLSCIQLFVAWIPFIVQKLGGYTLIPLIFTLVAALGAYIHVFRLLKHQGIAVDGKVA